MTDRHETMDPGSVPLIAMSDSQIRARAGSQLVWDGALRFCVANEVHLLANERSRRYVHAIVGGAREQYHVIVKLDRQRSPVSVACNCAVFAETKAVCRHVIAVFLYGSREPYQGEPEPQEPPSPWTKPEAGADDGFLTYQPQIAAEAKERGKARPGPPDDLEHEERYDPFERYRPPAAPAAGPAHISAPPPQPALFRTPRHTGRVNRALLDRLGTRPAPDTASPIRIRFELSLFVRQFRPATLSLRIGYRDGGHAYVVKKPAELIESLTSGRPLEFGKQFTLEPQEQPLSPADQALLDWLAAENQKSQDYVGGGWRDRSDFLQNRDIPLNPGRLADLLQLVARFAEDMDLGILMDGRLMDIPICRGWPPPRFALSAHVEGSRLLLTTTGAADAPPVPCYNTQHELTGLEYRGRGESGIRTWPPPGTGSRPQPSPDALYLLTPDARLLLYQDRLYLTPDEAVGRALYSVMATPPHVGIDSDYRELHFDDSETAELLERLRQPVAGDNADIYHIDPAMAAEIDTTPTPPSLWLDREGRQLVAKLRQPLPESRRRWVLRDRTGAAALSTALRDAGFRPLDGRHPLVRQAEAGDELWLLTDDAAIYQFLSDTLPPLIEHYAVYLSEALKRLLAGPLRPFRMHSRLNRESQLIDIELDDCPYSPEELEAILEATREKRRFVRLSDGRFLTLLSSGEDREDPADADAGKDGDIHTADPVDLSAATDSVDPARVLAILDTLFSWGARSRARADGSTTLELPVGRALALAALADDAGETGSPLTRDAGLARLDRVFRDPADSRIPLPTGLHAELRPYQKVGFQWLALLAQNELGGILADDMGLGKTLQALALILHVQQQREAAGETPLPSLVIAPTSLIFNWYDETRRFAPELPITVVEGSRAQREERLAAAGSSDLIVLSYAVLRRDIDLLRQLVFACCFLDEAQAIKNAATRTARAVKALRATHRFALTGTPIENALSELWSVFDFLMPGYLGSAARFHRLYVDEGRTEALRQLVAPFILRRMKSEVLRELPDKIETIIHCDMTVEQRALYLAWHQRAVDQVTNFARQKQPTARARARFGVLAILTRLRQVCCHPALFVENYRGGAGKFAALDELLDRLLASRHRILLFSQFTTMLALIGERLEAQGRPYFYIDGAVPAAERLDLVRRFNAGENDLFLISLRAGGTGLNLIGADTVIHYDPWWNPAAEEQASDRAHRIGQKRVVQVFRLVMRGSVEERIQLLQETKRELVREVIRPGENPLTRLSAAELTSLIGSGADDPGVAWPAEVADNEEDREDDAP
ncbi:MAG: SNF2-related protein [Bacillota bacterium]|nr:SNF2-related protein [Bacillota bacterium]